MQVGTLIRAGCLRQRSIQREVVVSVPLSRPPTTKLFCVVWLSIQQCYTHIRYSTSARVVLELYQVGAWHHRVRTRPQLSLSLSLSRPGLRRKLTSSTRTHHFPRAIRRGALLASAMCLCCCGSPCEAGLQGVHVSVVLLRARGPLALTVYIGATVGRGAAGCVPLVLRFADCMQPHAGQLPSLSVAALCVLPMRPPPSLSADLTLVMQTQMCYAARFWALLLHWPYSGRCTPRHSLVGCLSNLRWRIVRCKPVSET